MKVLFIASTDSYNVSLPPLIKKFQNMGHEVKIILTEHGFEHNHMFLNSDLPYETFEGKINDISRFDVAIFENVLNQQVLNLLKQNNIFCISMFYHAVPSQYVLGGGYLDAHLTLCNGEVFKESQIANGIKQELIPIGSPQYDDLFGLEQTYRNKTFLFLEQHFYPSGEDGKNQLASILLRTAEINKDFRIIVKPRSIPTEVDNAKHKAPHIYDYIHQRCENRLPANLILLEEHLDLNKLIAEASVIGTTFSTAVYPAILLNKPVIWVGGFSMVDTEFYNYRVVESYYDIYRGICRVVNYQELPDAIRNARSVSADIRDRLFYRFDGKAGDKIVKLVEYLQREVLSRDVVLPVMGLTYDNYERKISEYLKVHTASYNDKNRLTYHLNLSLNKSLERFYLVNLTTGYRLTDNYNQLKQRLEQARIQAVEEIKKSCNAGIIKIFESLCQEETERIIRTSVENLVRSEEDLPVGFKGWYISKLYKEGKFEELRALPYCFRVADYHYYIGIIAISEKRYKEAISHLEEFVREHKAAQYRYTQCHHNWVLELAQKELLKLHLKRFNLSNTILTFQEMKNRWKVVKGLLSEIKKLLR